MSPEYCADWVRKAESDAIAARATFTLSRKYPDQAEIACFHAQQSVEKYLKAVLTGHGKTFPRIHDLTALMRRIRHGGIHLRISAAHLHRLKQYAVEIRYPGATATVQEAQLALKAMENVRRICRKALKLR